MAEEIFFWLALSLIPGIGSILIQRLLDQFKTPEAVFRAPMKELLNIEGLGKKVACEIQKGPLERGVERELSFAETSQREFGPLRRSWWRSNSARLAAGSLSKNT